MKRILAIAALAAALSAPASAQMGGGRGLNNMKNETKEVDDRPKVSEQAYKDALERIPEAKQKYDPWGGVRDTKPDPKPKPK